MLSVQVFTFSPVRENTYLLTNEKNKGIIIDPGCYGEEEREALAGFITENEIEPTLLLQTHCHLDHVFGTKWVSEAYGLTPHIHPEEQEMLKLAPTSGLLWDLPFDNYQGELLFLEDGSTIQFGEDRLEAGLRALPNEDCSSTLAYLWNCIGEFSGNEPQNDDMTALAVSRCLRNSDQGTSNENREDSRV